MSTDTLQDIILPCWIFDQQFRTIIGQNSAAIKEGDVRPLLAEYQEQIEKELRLKGLSFFGSPARHIAYLVKDCIYVQCLNDNALAHEQYTKDDKTIQSERLEHQRTVAQLERHEATLGAIFESTAFFIWTMKADTQILDYNLRFEEHMMNWFEREIKAGNPIINEPLPENQKEWARFQKEMSNCLSKREKRILELKLMTVSGDEIWVEIHMDPIQAESGEVCCMGFEITDRIRSAVNVKTSLKEKETLLKEIHHRVKNNLQIISSLLSLQAHGIDDESMVQALQESKHRVETMSYIHESLYRTQDFARVDMREYVKGLCSNLVQSYSMSATQVDMQVEIEGIYLEIDQAIPCGLIINELITNALKYAYEDRDKGKLCVSMKESENQIMFSVKDDGPGLDPDWDPEESNTLGIQLVYTLTEQLDGQISVTGDNGTVYLITFDRNK